MTPVPFMCCCVAFVRACTDIAVHCCQHVSVLNLHCNVWPLTVDRSAHLHEFSFVQSVCNKHYFTTIVRFQNYWAFTCWHFFGQSTTDQRCLQGALLGNNKLSESRHQLVTPTQLTETSCTVTAQHMERKYCVVIFLNVSTC